MPKKKQNFDVNREGLLRAAEDMNRVMGLVPAIDIKQNTDNLIEEIKLNAKEVKPDDDFQDETWNVLHEIKAIPAQKRKTETITRQEDGGIKKVELAQKPVAGKEAIAYTEKIKINLSEIKEFPATLKEWQEKCGGKGFCLGGSGHKVNKRFRPGYDAKLKSALRRVGSKSAKSLANEIGWADKISW